MHLHILTRQAFLAVCTNYPLANGVVCRAAGLPDPADAAPPAVQAEAVRVLKSAMPPPRSVLRARRFKSRNSDAADIDGSA